MEGGAKVPQCRCFHSDEGTWEGEVHPSYGGRYCSTPLMEGGTAAPLLWREVQSPPSVVIKGLGRVKSGMQHPSYGGRYKSPPSVVIKGLGRV